MDIRQYINSIAQKGQNCFTLEKALEATSKSKSSLLAALRRLIKQNKLASPVRGFYLIIPPHYQVYQCLPAEQFVNDLMLFLQQPYYVGLLTAAHYHAAAHQKPQVFQVMTSAYRRNIRCGKITIQFITNEHIALIPTKKLNTPAGYITVSSPEATAIDLLQYPLHSGGINNIATVLIELAEAIDRDELAKAIIQLKPPILTLQRLGYLFELVDETLIAEVIFKFISTKKLHARPLVNGLSTRNCKKADRWQLYINYTVEADL